MATDGWFASAFYYLWQIALFISLGESFAGYGEAMALARLAGAAGGLIAGRLVDRGHARRSVLLAYGWCAVVVIFRAASFGNPALAVATNALGATTPSPCSSRSDDQGLQPLPGLALSAPIPHRHRGRLGHRLRHGLPDGGRSAGARRHAGPGHADRPGGKRRRGLRPAAREATGPAGSRRPR